MSLTVTQEPVTAVESTRIVRAYAELDRQIKVLEAQREELKPTAIEALRTLPHGYETQEYSVKLVIPAELEVDLTQLQAHVSVRKFRELTNRVPNITAIRAHLTAHTFSNEARRAITHKTGTPRINIFRKVVG